eukprot:TRINITY_DN55435_c0_g1_i1.p1 TRINITY_DN55435_c0_g1~~TRINITY_DN55435_c0_g1_i1.p1  ORF type:complete len:223 (+),score=30.74 TRINITY_DN55435_c0_g1_i1:73-741(+)
MAEVALESVSMAPKVAMGPPAGIASFDVAQQQPRSEATSGSRSGSMWNVSTVLRDATHPMTCIFHAAFKITVVLIYFMGRWFSGLSYVMTFILATVFAAVDFWTVKNVTGRLLVGLRWWNYVREDGSSTWIFESNPEEDLVNKIDRTVFWTLLYVWPLLWLVIFVVNVIGLSFEWMLLNLMTFTFATANLAGYWKCSKAAKKRTRDWVERQGVNVVSRAMGF